MSILFKTGSRRYLYTTRHCLAVETKGGRTNRKRSTQLPDNFLSTHYFSKVKPSDPLYDSFVDRRLWKELEYNIESSLLSKGAMAALNHTDHLELHVPYPGACYFQDHIVKKLAAKSKANLLVLDVFDLVNLAQHTFLRYQTSLLSKVSSAQDMNSNSLLNVKRLMDEKQQDADRLKNSIKEDAVKVYRKEEQEEEWEEEEEEEELVDDEDEKLTVYFKGKDYDISLNDLTEKEDKATEILLNQVSNKYTTLFRQALDSSCKKIIHLRDCAVMQDAFTRLMLKSLVTAVEDLRQRGQSLMILATHSQKSSVKEQFLGVFNNMHTREILPPSDKWNLWKDRMKMDESKRIAEINAKGWVTFCHQKHTLKMHIPTHQDKLVDDLRNLPGMSDMVWSLQEVNRRATAVMGHAIERQKSLLDFQDFKIVNSMLLSKPQNMFEKATGTIQSDGIVDLEALKETCNSYERKLLSRIVDPNKVQGSFADIRTKPSTVDALQSLISLPLTRPEFFNHGILKKNFIPGVLLFGPSGTGKVNV
ncbi:unnamed protein product [Rhizopus stolonifer]